MTYKAKPEALTDALVSAEITSAAELARRAKIAPNTAQAVMRGDVVTLATVTKVRRALDSTQPSALFEFVKTAGAES